MTPGRMVANPETGKLNVTNDASDAVVWRFNLGLGHDAPLLEREPTPAPPAPAPPAAEDAVAVFVGKPVVRGGRSYTFRVEYRGVDAATLGDDDVVVTDPRGAVVPAKLVKVRRHRGGPPVVATYRVKPPHGRFGRAPAGQYTVRVAPGSVALPDRIGTFEVRRGKRGKI